MPERGTVIARACLRDGSGGSPTAVVPDGSFTEEERRAVPADWGTSHAVFFSVRQDQVWLRFFTEVGELPACGHGTVAALAVLAERSGLPEYRATLHAGGRAFPGRAVRRPAGFEASFDPGPVTVRETTAPLGCAARWSWAHLSVSVIFTSKSICAHLAAI